MFIVLLSSTISMPSNAWEFNQPPLGISLFWLLPFGLITLLITYLLLINRRLQRSQQDLIMSEQRLKRTVEGSGDTLWDWDIASGEIVRINDKYMVCKDQPYDKSIIIPNAHRIHPQDLPLVDKLLKQHFAEKSVFFEASYRLKDTLNQYHRVLDRGKIIEKDTNLNPIRMTGTVRDISHLKSTEERLNLFAK